MAIIPWKNRNEWDPFRELKDLQKSMNSLLDTSLSRFPESDSELLEGADWMPSIDVDENSERIKVKAELPGMKKDDVSISIEDQNLVIKGEKKEEKEEKDEEGNRYYRECSYGSFQRAINIPSEVKEDEIKASYKNGVLKITIPKKEEKKSKKLDIDID